MEHPEGERPADHEDERSIEEIAQRLEEMQRELEARAPVTPSKDDPPADDDAA